MEEYKAPDFRFDGFVVYLVELVVFWHFFSRLIRSLFEIDRKQYSTIWPLFFFTVAVFVMKIVYFFVWTKGIDRKNSFLKHFFNLLYVLLQVISGTPLGEMS